MKRAKNALKRADKLLLKLHAEQKKVMSEIKRLHRQGATAGTIHWQEKRPGYEVAYLNHATSESENGKRIREYIGNDMKKVNAAQARIDRAAKIRVLQMDLRNINHAIDRMALLLSSAVDQCSDTSNGQNRMW